MEESTQVSSAQTEAEIDDENFIDEASRDVGTSGTDAPHTPEENLERENFSRQTEQEQQEQQLEIRQVSQESQQEQEEDNVYRMPDSIEVRIEGDDGRVHVIQVQILRENLQSTKAFLGGFRRKVSGIVYHHAWTQTVRRRRKEGVIKYERETQTKVWTTRSQQTTRESGTQMDRKDMIIDHSNDRVITSSQYFSADELEKLKDEKAREVQCFLRQCFAWRRVRQLREAQKEEEDSTIKLRSLESQQKDEEHQKQLERRTNPRTAADFQVLYKEVEAWRLHETARIKSSNDTSEQQHAQLADLLHKEVKLLQAIDKLKTKAASENKETTVLATLEKMASPQEWSAKNGDNVEVETPFTTRARELVELYNGLCLPDLPKEQRIDVLLHVKYTVKEFQCELTDDILELIVREQDLLRRGRGIKSLVGLRKRLSNLFLQFLSTPQFNPQAAVFQNAPPPAEVLPSKPNIRSRTLRAL